MFQLKVEMLLIAATLQANFLKMPSTELVGVEEAPNLNSSKNVSVASTGEGSGFRGSRDHYIIKRWNAAVCTLNEQFGAEVCHSSRVGGSARVQSAVLRRHWIDDQ